MTSKSKRTASYEDGFVWAEAVSYKESYDGHSKLEVVFRAGINEERIKAYETELILYDDEKKNREMLSSVSPEATDKLEPYMTFYLKLPEAEWQKRSKALGVEFENMITAVAGIRPQTTVKKVRREK